MRPINKGTAPRVYNNYQDAANDLQDCIGCYCCYCERQIETNLAVEHIKPKSLVPGLRNSWTNFLLACTNCNSCKGRTPIVLNNYLWPDTDNTLLAFTYSIGGIVSANTAIPISIRRLANATIRLVGLDVNPGNPIRRRRPTSRDKRWKRRLEVWQLADHLKLTLINNNNPVVRDLIIQVAIPHGMFSIWWTVFNNDQDMKTRLRAAFIGTALDCFDAIENLQTRPGGQI